MFIKRSTRKKLSVQLPVRAPLYEEDYSNTEAKDVQLTPKSFFVNEGKSDEESEAAINNIINSYYEVGISEFQSPIKLIQANSSEKKKSTEAKKSCIKAKLIQKLKQDNFSRIANIFKESTSTNTGSTSNYQEPLIAKKQSSDDSLVNLESGDESPGKISDWHSPSKCTGNSGIISLILKQATMLRKNSKYKKQLLKAMHKATWTDWFMIGFSDTGDDYSLYGRKSHSLIKIVGKDNMPSSVAFTQIRKSFKYDWINQRFKDAIYCWDSDAVIIRSLF
jgi:hypothetical protein